MEQTEQKDLFDLKINDSGKKFIRKFASLVRPIIVVGIVIYLIRFTEQIIHILYDKPDLYRTRSAMFFEHRLLPYYVAVIIILGCLQFYYYWKVGRLLTRAIVSDNETDLNDSFKALFQNALYGLIIFILSLCLNVLDLYNSLTFHL